MISLAHPQYGSSPTGRGARKLRHREDLSGPRHRRVLPRRAADLPLPQQRQQAGPAGPAERRAGAVEHGFYPPGHMGFIGDLKEIYRDLMEFIRFIGDS